MLNKSIPWATVVLVALVVIVALVGGGVVIWGQPGALSFQQYLDDLKNFGIAVGLLGVGRGIKSGLENSALFSAPVNGDALIPPPSADGGDERPSGASHV